jgi:hypothetical protein
MAGWKLFGFEIDVSKEKKEAQLKSFTPPTQEDGAITIQSGSYYGTYVDLDGIVRNELELITKYREMAIQPEMENAVSDLVDEAIVNDDDGKSVEVIVDRISNGAGIKKKIEEEFSYILRLLDFENYGHDIFRQWYVDGRLFYHVLINEERPRDGIKELRKIDPRRIRKVREVQRGKDAKSGFDVIKTTSEYYLYNERGIVGGHSNLGSKIAVDSVVNVNSGLMDSKRAMVLSYLHKAIKPFNNLRMVEDSVVIYRLSRAPERRIFYIDVGNMPTVKAEQYLKDIATKYRNKLVYDSATGDVRDDRKHLSMLEDFWLPRREGSRGTEIDTLPAGQNLGELEDVKYFEKKLYKALGVPLSRLEQSSGFTLGRVAEVTRDELKFAKFVQRLRNKFSELFDNLLRVQCILKGICSIDEWKEIKEEIWYDFLKDNNFNELKEAELNKERVGLLMQVDPFVGRYYSQEWVRKNVLRHTDEEIGLIDKQIEEEMGAAQEKGVDIMGNPLPPPIEDQEQQFADANTAPEPGAPMMSPDVAAQSGAQRSVPMQERKLIRYRSFGNL